MALGSGFINVAIKAAYAAGNLIQQASRSLATIKVIQKSDKDYVTQFDRKAEQIIIDTLKKSYPDYNIISEERADEDNSSEYTWIIDPIDGTTNFIHGHPQYCVSIALKQFDKIIGGVIFDPNRNDLYCAQLGRGAFLNDSRIRVSKTNTMNKALIATGFPSYDLSYIDKYLAIFKEMIIKSSGQRRCGSAALDLAFVAAGLLDGFWEYNLKIWDVAAGYIIVKEAGGIVTDFNDANVQNDGSIIAGNPKMHAELLKIIRANI